MKLQIRIASMSFRNHGSTQRPNIKKQDKSPSQLFLSSKFAYKTPNASPDQQVMTKVADLIANLHESLLLKCQNIEIYRDLSQQEQSLLLQVDKNTCLHTVLAGTLAIDSCFKSLEREEQFVVGNLLRANIALISGYKSIERQYSQNRISNPTIQRLNDSIKFFVQQLQALPSAKGLEHELEKQISILESGESAQESEEWLKGEHTNLMSDLQKENELLRIGMKQKENYIKTLENRLERGGYKLDKAEQRRAATSSKVRLGPQKTIQSEQYPAEVQQLYAEVCKLREQVQQKSKIIFKMNEEFASEMQKYNSVFRRLEEENRILKKYNDVETGYLLEELELELDMLREQKRNDQLIISDIQHKIQSIGYPRMSRVHTQTTQPFPAFDRFERPSFPEHHPGQYQQRNTRYPKQFYSPNFNSRMGAYSRVSPSPFREPGLYPPSMPPTAGSQNYRTRASRRDSARTKSQARYQAMQESRENKDLGEFRSSAHINLLQRVISKK